jgi:hypothetical protein
MKKKDEEEEKAKMEQIAAEKAQAEKKIEGEKDKLALQKKEFAIKQKIAAAKQAQIKAQLEEEKA